MYIIFDVKLYFSITYIWVVIVFIISKTARKRIKNKKLNTINIRYTIVINLVLYTLC